MLMNEWLLRAEKNFFFLANKPLTLILDLLTESNSPLLLNFATVGPKIFKNAVEDLKN